MDLNLPGYQFKIRKSAHGKSEIFDVFRKKFIMLTPEEWVRQNFLRFLVEEKGYPETLILIEKGLMVNKMHRRFDAVVYSTGGKPAVLLEFKAPGVMIGQKVFEQIAAYNFSLRVNYLMVSNGMSHYCCRLDFTDSNFKFMDGIPQYSQLEMEST